MWFYLPSADGAQTARNTRTNTMKQTTPSLQRRSHLLLKVERPLRTTAVDQVLKLVASLFWRLTVAPTQRCSDTHSALPTLSVTPVLMFWTFWSIILSNSSVVHNFRSVIYHNKKEKGALNPFVSERCFSFYTKLGPSRILTPYPTSCLLCSTTWATTLVCPTVQILNDYIFSTSAHLNLGCGSMRWNFDDSWWLGGNGAIPLIFHVGRFCATLETFGFSFNKPYKTSQKTTCLCVWHCESGEVLFVSLLC